MDTSQTSITERLTLDGPLPLEGVIVIGLLAVLGCGVLLWRERRITGLRIALLFGLLRTIVIGVVMWMLLAPTNQRVEITTTPRAVSVIVDTTGSMRTIDPVGTSDEVRWMLAADESQASPMRSVDEAVTAIGLARTHLRSAIAGLEQHLPETVIAEHIVTARKAIEGVEAKLEALQNRDLSPSASAMIRERRAGLEDAEFRSFRVISTALERGQTPTQTGWRESLPDFESRLARTQRLLRELARQVEGEERERLWNIESTPLTTHVRQSRGERVTRVVRELQRTTLAEVEERGADITLGTFDQMVIWNRESGIDDAQPSPNMTDDGEVPGTDLAKLLEQIHQQNGERPRAATFVLTDVAQNRYGDRTPQEWAGMLNDSPVYIVPIGNPGFVRDIQLRSVSAPAVAMRNDDIVIEANIEAHDCTGETGFVELRLGEEVIDTREIKFDSEFVTRAVRFEQRVPEIGEQTFAVSVRPIDGESSEANNSDAVTVSVTRSDIKVLLADAFPRWEYRYLTQLFRRDPKVECDELLFHPRRIATGRRKESQTLPTTIDEWDQYDVVLLGDLPPEYFPLASQQSLTRYLRERGGTAVLIAGRDAMPEAFANSPLGEILPVSRIEEESRTGEDFAFRVTEQGLEHHALMIGETEAATRTAWEFVNRFAPLHEVSPWRRALPSAETLIAAIPRTADSRTPDEADGQVSPDAFLCWQPLGRGRIVYLAGPETHHLRFLRGDRLHYRFWGQLLRWAIASDLSTGTKYVRIRTSKARYRVGEPITATVELSDAEGQPLETESLQLRITSDDEDRTVPLRSRAGIPGEYVAELRSLPTGNYRLEPIGAAIDAVQPEDENPTFATIDVQAERSQELIDTRTDLALAQQIAEATGAQVLPPTAIGEVLALTNLEPIVSETLERRPLWLAWKFLWIVFACLQVEWAIRKWNGWA